jgi:hypothetical protein
MMTHEEVEDYNWDDGLDPIWLLINDEMTDRGTALLIYWRIEGPFLKAEDCRHNHELWRMKQTLEERIKSGFYKNAEIQYDPVADNQLTKVQVYKLKKSGIDGALLGDTLP